jgi:hypothetical protein
LRLFLLDSVFRRIPSPKYAEALLNTMLVLWHVKNHSGKQSGRRAAAIPLVHGYH